MKHYLQSRTFWSIILTAAVWTARGYVGPHWQPLCDNAETLLMLSGLWFARLGAGKPITLGGNA